MKEEKKSNPFVPYNVFNKPIVKVALATSLVFSMGTTSIFKATPLGVQDAKASVQKPLINAASTQKLLINASVGETITFANSEWVVLDPFEGLVQKKLPVSIKSLDSNGVMKYDLNDPNNLAYFLNTTWYNLLSSEEKELIQTKEWTINQRLFYQIRSGITEWQGSSGQSRYTMKWGTVDIESNVLAKVGLFDKKMYEKGLETLSTAIGGTKMSLFFNFVDNTRQYSEHRETGYNAEGETRDTFREHTPPTDIEPSHLTTGKLEMGLTANRNLPSISSYSNYYFNINGNNINAGTNSNQPLAVQPFLYLNPNASLIDGKIAINSPSHVSLYTSDGDILSEINGHNSLLISGHVKDTDIGDILYVKYSIDGVSYHTDNTISHFPANGANQTFEKEIKIDRFLPEGNHTLKVWVEDDKGNRTADIVRSFIVDKTPPEITISDVNEGETYIGSVTPTVSVSDPNEPTYSMKLNDKTYSGEPISTSGTHTLVIDAEDAAGNKSTKSITFGVNQTPEIKETIDNQTWAKNKEEIIDLLDFFEDAENDKLTFEASSSDEDIVSIIQNDSKITLKAHNQGSTTISITANDGNSTSEALTFDIEVTTVPPKLTINNDVTVILDDQTTWKLEGTVFDPDQEDVLITATIDGNQQQITITTTGSDDQWNLSFDGSSLSEGIHQVAIDAVDPNNAKDEYKSNTVLVKVSGKASDYEEVVSSYEDDIRKDRDNMTREEHITLLEAYKAHKGIYENSTKEEMQLAKETINRLVDGSVKKNLLKMIENKLMEDINTNPENITNDDLIDLGLENVLPELENEYKDAITDYIKDKGEDLGSDDLQKVIDAVNAVDKAKDGTAQDITDANKIVDELEDGTLKDKLKEEILDAAVNEVIKNPGSVSKEILEIGEFENVNGELNEDYQEALVGYEQPLTKESVQAVIDVVNQVKKTRLDLTQADVNTLNDMVDRLVVSETKTNLTAVKDTLKSIFDAEQYMNAENLRIAFDLVGALETREKVYLEKMVSSLSLVRIALSEPSDETVRNAQGELTKLDRGDLKDRLQNRVGGAYLEHVITSPGSSTQNDWINAGFENMNEEDFNQYKDAVTTITNEVGSLTKEQIQAIIDAINAMNAAKANPTNKTIQDARDSINKVVENQLKTEWLREMDELWKQIQPRPNPTPVPDPVPEQPSPPVVNPDPLPKPSENTMVVSNDKAALVMTIPQIEVAQSNSLKVTIKVSAKDILEGSKLYIYANQSNIRAMQLAGVLPPPPLVTGGKQAHMLEIDFGKLNKGTIEVDRDLVFNEKGEYQLQGIFEANGTQLETNKVTVSVYNELLIPNTVLPNQHGLPVAMLKTKQDIPLFKKDKDGSFVKAGIAKTGTHHKVYGTEKGYYEVSDGYFIQPSQAITVHIGKGEVRKDEVNVYDKNGKYIRTLKKGQEYKVYSYDNKRYAIGGGEFIEVQDGVTYVFGWITVKEPMTLYKPDGTAERTLKAGEQYRVYRADKDNLHLGGGYTVKRANSKYDFLKN